MIAYCLSDFCSGNDNILPDTDLRNDNDIIFQDSDTSKDMMASYKTLIPIESILKITPYEYISYLNNDKDNIPPDADVCNDNGNHIAEHMETVCYKSHRMCRVAN
jgi:hypothetical protein